MLKKAAYDRIIQIAKEAIEREEKVRALIILEALDHTPATVATATSKKTTKRFFADSSMSALIMARVSR